MSINLITDGWLYPIISRRPLPPPDDPDGVIDYAPGTPCAPTGAPTDAPPVTPTGMQAAGPTTPVVPCGTTGNDPTITPPAVPVGQEGSETANNEAPKVPGCPEGEVT